MRLTKNSLIIIWIFVITWQALGQGVESRLHFLELQTEDVDHWVDENHQAVTSRLLPEGEVLPAKFPKNVKWIVVVRISPPFDEPEYRFLIQKTYEGGVELSVTAPKGRSISAQMRTLKKQNPEATLDRISGMIELEHKIITQRDQPQLGQLADEFENMKISPMLPDELRMDGTGYRIWSQSLWGNRMSLTLDGPGAKAKNQPHPLLKWVEAVRTVAESPVTGRP